MKGWIEWPHKQISRRRLLQKGLASTFATLALLSVGEQEALASCGNTCYAPWNGTCSGPNQTGYCGSDLCQGWACKGSSDGSTSCYYTSGFCESRTNCWSQTYNGTCFSCCDCSCIVNTDGFQFYCYCSGTHG